MQNRKRWKGSRYKYNLPLSEWTVKELEESMRSIQKFIEDHSPSNPSYKDYLAKLTVERTSRIGKK